ncbi:MAG: hypothetical protein NT154_21215 [Verrucomicrobia bacterium]|nr:hypothetical protein [Verrucomicrobiota bacterium]
MMKRTLQVLLDSILLVTAGTVLLGCKSMDKPASASFASVRIQGHTREQIRGATVVVFQQAGYAAADVSGADMIFETEGSRWDQIAYGSWVNDAPVWIRVRVSMVALSTDLYRLQCQAYKVRNKGDPLTEDQVIIKNRNSKPYQALLDKVLGQLNR